MHSKKYISKIAKETDVNSDEIIVLKKWRIRALFHFPIKRKRPARKYYSILWTFGLKVKEKLGKISWRIDVENAMLLREGWQFYEPENVLTYLVRNVLLNFIHLTSRFRIITIKTNIGILPSYFNWFGYIHKTSSKNYLCIIKQMQKWNIDEW